LSLFPTWSSLRSIGNSWPAKAGALIPFVGYIILFNKHLVETFAGQCIAPPCGGQILFPKLYFLYFGLTFFGTGSFLYQLRCDIRIKRFGNLEDYVLSAKEVATEGELHKYQQLVDHLSGTAVATTDFIRPQLSDPELGSQLKLDILTRHYRALDESKPLSRFFVFFAYILGFSLMAVPALTTFAEVTKSLLQSWK
jgi:hypothetical protein